MGGKAGRATAIRVPGERGARICRDSPRTVTGPRPYAVTLVAVRCGGVPERDKRSNPRSTSACASAGATASSDTSPI